MSFSHNSRFSVYTSYFAHGRQFLNLDRNSGYSEGIRDLSQLSQAFSGIVSWQNYWLRMLCARQNSTIFPTKCELYKRRYNSFGFLVSLKEFRYLNANLLCRLIASTQSVMITAEPAHRIYGLAHSCIAAQQRMAHPALPYGVARVPRWSRAGACKRTTTVA